MTKVLAAEIAARLPHIDAQRAFDHGFHLFGAGDAARDGRRRQAQTTLLAEHTVASLVPKIIGPALLIKGLEVAQLYPAPHWRPFRDVDLMVADADAAWDACRAVGYLNRPDDPDLPTLHQRPPLLTPDRRLGVDLHARPNTPGWASVDPDFIRETAQPSRTGIPGVQRPRDDVHALLMALHSWKASFSRQRDLFDAVLLASHSDVPVDETAASLGLGRFWAWTVRAAEALLVGGSSGSAKAVRFLAAEADDVSKRRRSRVLLPFLVVDPLRAARGTASDLRLPRRG